jgi:hypothetical protein
MIVEFDTNTSVIDILGLLVIDWWDECDRNEVWSRKVKTELQKFDFQTVIVANYGIKPSLEDPAQFNTIQQYGWHDYKSEILSPLLKECGGRESNRFIRDNYGDKSFALLDVNSMLLHLDYTSQTHIKNWLVVGGSWGECTHKRPVGFFNLKNKPYNFFITKWSIYKQQSTLILDDIENDCLYWICYRDSLYKLSTKNQ